MAVELRMPSLGMAMDEGKLAAWMVKPGDCVRRGQVVAEIESEKVAYEIEAPADGVVGALLVAVDEVVPVGTTLLLIEDGGETVAMAATPLAPERAEHAERAERATAQPLAAAPQAGSRHTRLSPRARKLAESLGVDLAAVTGSGPEGLVVEEDIRRAADKGSTQAPSASAEPPFVLRPLTLMRRTIAERMTSSAHEAPHFSLAVEVDGSALLAYRQAHAPRLQAQTGLQLTVTDLLVWATARTLRAHPALNAAYAADGVREFGEVNVSLAVAVDDGLVAPVLRRADASALADLMRARVAIVERARSGRLRADDVAGGTFTLSNLGGFGIDFFSSILNAGQAAILSVGALRERPAAVRGELVVRPLMTLVLTIDHRVADGAAGARFLADVKQRIEQFTMDG